MLMLTTVRPWNPAPFAPVQRTAPRAFRYGSLVDRWGMNVVRNGPLVLVPDSGWNPLSSFILLNMPEYVAKRPAFPRCANRSFHWTFDAFEVMFEDPTSTVFRILLRRASRSVELNRYILVCSTPWPRHEKLQRCAKVRRGVPSESNTLVPSEFSSRRHAGSFERLRWLFIRICTLRHRRRAAAMAAAKRWSVMEYSETWMIPGTKAGLLGHSPG